jgi:hypothetical protein
MKTSGTDTVTVSEEAKRQIASQAIESKSRGPSFFEGFTDIAPAPRYRPGDTQ